MNMFSRNSNKFYKGLTVSTIALLCILLTSLGHSREIQIVDSTGNSFRFTKPFTRIISLYSAHTENLCSMGASNQLIAVSRSNDSPPDLDKPRLSYRDDPERFLVHKPDLVLIRPMISRSYPQFVQKLQLAGVQVVSLQPNSMTEMFSYWQTLGKLAGKEDEAEQMIVTFNQKLLKMKEQIDKIPDSARPKVYFQSIHKKMKTFAPESIGSFVLEHAGGINIALDAKQVRKTNIAYYGKEKLLSKGAEIDFFIAQQGRMNPINVNTIMQEPGFGGIKAVQEGKVFLIQEALISRPTLRILDGITQLHDILYTPIKN